jgi:hypothetical protein
MMAAGASVNTAFASATEPALMGGDCRIHRREDGWVGVGRPDARCPRKSKQSEKGENR